MVLSAELLLAAVLLINLISCAFMCGLTTFVHFVHYPGFVFAAPDSAVSFHTFHSNRTAAVVAFPMLAELGSAVALPFMTVGSMLFWPALFLAGLLGFIWFETAFRVIPVHSKMSISGLHDAKLVHRLCSRNLLRTIAWNVRMLVLTVLSLFLFPAMHAM